MAAHVTMAMPVLKPIVVSREYALALTQSRVRPAISVMTLVLAIQQRECVRIRQRQTGLRVTMGTRAPRLILAKQERALARTQ